MSQSNQSLGNFVLSLGWIHGIDRIQIYVMLATICNNIKGGDLVSNEILEKNVKTLGVIEV